jgi:hypothetical protein
MEKVLEHQFVGDRPGCLNDLFDHPPKDETKH